MAARITGASLGLFAFAVTLVAGLLAGNTATVTLSRGLIALFLFCVLGLVVGGAARRVIAEHRATRETRLTKRGDELDSQGSGEGKDRPATAGTAEDLNQAS